MVLPTDWTTLSRASRAERVAWHNELHALYPVLGLSTTLTVGSTTHLTDHEALHAHLGGALPLDVAEDDPDHLNHHLNMHHRARCQAVPGLVAATPATFTQALLTANPRATFCLADGLYETGELTLIAGQRIWGSRDAVFDGRVAVTNWTQTGPSLWQSTGQGFNPTVVVPDGSGGTRQCEAHPENCHYADLTRNDVRVQRVLNTTSPGPGQWAWDYTTDVVYYGGPDPTAADMRLTNRNRCFVGAGYILMGCTIRWYGTRGIEQGNDQIIDGTAFLHNHELGVKLGARSQLRNFYCDDNAQYALVAGAGAGIVIEDGEVIRSNSLRFANSSGGYWDAGACKAILTDGLVVRRIYSHHNYSDGWWTDIDNINSQVYDCQFSDNERYGYFHEISFALAFHHNQCLRNGDSGFDANTSEGMDVYENDLIDNGLSGIELWDSDRGTSATFGTVYQLRNNSVHNNRVRQRTGKASAIRGGIHSGCDAAQNNDFDLNAYVLDTGAGTSRFLKCGTTQDKAGWQSTTGGQVQDPNSTFTT